MTRVHSYKIRIIFFFPCQGMSHCTSPAYEHGRIETNPGPKDKVLSLSKKPVSAMQGATYYSSNIKVFEVTFEQLVQDLYSCRIVSLVRQIKSYSLVVLYIKKKKKKKLLEHNNKLVRELLLNCYYKMEIKKKMLTKFYHII